MAVILLDKFINNPTLLIKMPATNIRPYQILSIPDDFPEEVKFFMPQAQGAGSITTLESIILIKLLRLTKAENIFEYGTYKGITTRLLLENYPHEVTSDLNEPVIYTLDLESTEGIKFIASDEEHALTSLKSKRKYLDRKNSHLVQQLLSDSKNFDPTPYKDKFQFIFIDANHEVSYVKNDTEKSLKMLDKSKKSCIIWHDYGTKDFPELTEYVKHLDIGMNIYHVENTMLAFCVSGIDEALLKTRKN